MCNIMILMCFRVSSERWKWLWVADMRLGIGISCYYCLRVSENRYFWMGIRSCHLIGERLVTAGKMSGALKEWRHQGVSKVFRIRSDGSSIGLSFYLSLSSSAIPSRERLKIFVGDATLKEKKKRRRESYYTYFNCLLHRHNCRRSDNGGGGELMGLQNNLIWAIGTYFQPLILSITDIAFSIMHVRKMALL